MMRASRFAPVFALLTAGCLASKGDIRLLQDEFRATRAQLGMVDTSIVRTNEQRRQQIATLQSQVDRLILAQEHLSDSLRTLTARFVAFQGRTSGELNALGEQMVQTQALLGQNVKNLQETRAQLEQMRESPGLAAPSTGTTPGGAPPAGPGPATLYTTGLESLRSGAYSTARMSFEQLVTTYPTAFEAPKALYNIGESYRLEENKTAADSVYRLVVERYPKSDDAATAMFKRATVILWPDQKAEARALLQKLLKEYPASTAAPLAQDFLRNNR